MVWPAQRTFTHPLSRHEGDGRGRKIQIWLSVSENIWHSSLIPNSSKWLSSVFVKLKLIFLCEYSGKQEGKGSTPAHLGFFQNVAKAFLG